MLGFEPAVVDSVNFMKGAPQKKFWTKDPKCFPN